jgi:monoterpene epsilon-lactone hydrolase
MTPSTMSATLETRHPLPADERPIEHAMLARIGQLFARFTGSRREAYDAMTAATPIATGVTFDHVDDADTHGVWARPDGAPADRAILFIHGGAYMLGSAQAYRGFVSQIAARAGVAVFSLDYPLAPEQPFPAAYDAAVAARRWLGAQGLAQIALVGDSCGAGLVLATLGATAAGSPAVASVAVFSPWTDLALTGPSILRPETHDPIFQVAILQGAAKAYLGAADPTDPRASPFYGVPAALPPLLVQVGADELLLDDARRYAACAAERGGVVRLDVFEGLHHVFQRSAPELPSAGRALDDAAAFVSAHWRR